MAIYGSTFPKMAAPRFPNPLAFTAPQCLPTRFAPAKRPAYPQLFKDGNLPNVSTPFVSIRGHQFFCYPSYQKWQSEAIRCKWIAQTFLAVFIGAYLPNVCWTVTNWGQASVSLNRRPSQRSQINSLHDISGRTLRSTVRIIPPKFKKKNGRKSHDTKTRIKKALLIWIFKFHVWLLNLHEHLGMGKSCAWKLRWGFQQKSSLPKNV